MTTFSDIGWFKVEDAEDKIYPGGQGVENHILIWLHTFQLFFCVGFTDSRFLKGFAFGRNIRKQIP